MEKTEKLGWELGVRNQRRNLEALLPGPPFRLDPTDPDDAGLYSRSIGLVAMATFNASRGDPDFFIPQWLLGGCRVGFTVEKPQFKTGENTHGLLGLDGNNCVREEV